MNHEIPDKSLTENIRETTLPRSPRKISLVIFCVMLLAGLGVLVIHTGASKPELTGKYDPRGQQVTPVTVAMVTQKTVPIQLQAIGNVQASSTVAIAPQASGRIMGVYFKKGQELKKGQLLFTLDDRTQTAAMQQAQGVLAKDQAQIEQARATLARDQGLVRQAQATLAKDTAQGKYSQAQSQRYTQLYKEGAVSQDQAQQYSTNGQVSVATLQADREAIQNAREVVEGDLAAIQNAEAVKSVDRAALDNVKVQLSYTKIYAPIDGRAGNILVTQGNVVQANSSNPLVIITTIRPIQVSFAIPEANLPQVQNYMDNGKLKVDVMFSNSEARPIPGILTFINNTVDNSTGTIQLIGDFDNAKGHLFPGQFVNTTLTLTQELNATVVPAQAVQDGPDGQFVFVVKPDMTVENTPVTVSSTIDGLDVIQKGIKPGDRVVTDGQANLVTGSKIKIKTASDAGGGNDSNSTRNPDSQPGRHHHTKPAGGTP